MVASANVSFTRTPSVPRILRQRQKKLWLEKKVQVSVGLIKKIFASLAHKTSSHLNFSFRRFPCSNKSMTTPISRSNEAHKTVPSGNYCQGITYIDNSSQQMIYS